LFIYDASPQAAKGSALSWKLYLRQHLLKLFAQTEAPIGPLSLSPCASLRLLSVCLWLQRRSQPSPARSSLSAPPSFSTAIPTTDKAVAGALSVSLLLPYRIAYYPISNHGPQGGTNKFIDKENPSNLGQQGTDSGIVPNLKWRFSDSKVRYFFGGWLREQVIQDLPQSHEIAAAQQHLKKGAIRELHWHRVVSNPKQFRINYVHD
jgi:hypothetical protein